MSDRPDVPQFGALLREHIASVPDHARPAFLAGLERSAAARYRRWAEALPDHAELLTRCAAREDRIADLVSEAFPIDDATRAQVDEALPAAVQVYYDVFEPHHALDQLYLQSEAELQGAMAWVGIADGLDDDDVVTRLAECTELERASAREVKALLDRLPDDDLVEQPSA